MNSNLFILSDFKDLPLRLRRRPRRRRLVLERNCLIRDRENPFEMLDDIEFKHRFCLSKNSVTFLLQYIGPTLQPRTRRNKAICAARIDLRLYPYPPIKC
ncbi:hypothetical protein ABEB36_004650 [Hypothenemus hampei]|uniref:Uncharacterized protein n=1 Tax=Hypothenemus hampei TaxID=57062 RepID=A0ABD1F7P5_HYPHA